jgi:hypothetical protein
VSNDDWNEIDRVPECVHASERREESGLVTWAPCLYCVVRTLEGFLFPFISNFFPSGKPSVYHTFLESVAKLSEPLGAIISTDTTLD